MSVVVANQPSLWCCSRCHAIYRKEFPFCPADGGEVVPTDSDPLLGAELGQYVVESLIGEGAMGRVYRAHHKHLADRVYAVKVLLGDLASTQEMRMRFLNEARSASKLSHPNVVTVYDVGRTDKGLLYLAMELVEGTPLSDLIEGGPMDPTHVAKLARGICDGLAHAHAHGIVHRDLKPENVIVVRGPDGEEVPRIVDFGIAVSIEGEDSRLTATGMSMGTPGYVAPEQVSGGRVDASADQYALGVTMFEMLTGGTLPFVGSAMEVAAAKTVKDAPPVSSLMPSGSVPPALERMVARMLSRRPGQRYESVAGVSRMLARWLHAPETEVIAYPSRWPRLAIVAALVVVLAGGGAFAWTQLRSTDEPRATPAIAVRTATVSPIAVASDETGSDAIDMLDDEPDDTAVADPKQPSRKRPHRTAGRKKKEKRVETRVAVEAPAPPTPTPPPAPTPTPPPSLPITGKVQRVAVSGALSQTDVRRAIQRIEPALRRCTASAHGTAQIRFTVDNSRRPRGVHGSGAPGATLTCLVSALGTARMEVAPDVGDAEVVVDIVFSSST